MVLIYFDEHTKVDVMKKMAEALSSDGYLVLADTIGGAKTRPSFAQSDIHGVYVKPHNAPPRAARAAG